jgi:D-alanyl-D-alanine carboxypeptidase
MLPSGNDASVVIAEALGKIIHKYKKKQTIKTYYETFIAHMNILSRELGLEQSWKNSSGLSVCPNYSTPKAAACLAVIAIMNENLREIVNCQKY